MTAAKKQKPQDTTIKPHNKDQKGVTSLFISSL